jgi:hypothetical protein
MRAAEGEELGHESSHKWRSWGGRRGEGGGGEAKEAEVGETEEMGLATELKLGQVPRLRCSEAVREGLEAEKTASQREQRSLTAFGKLVSGFCTSRGSR